MISNKVKLNGSVRDYKDISKHLLEEMELDSIQINSYRNFIDNVIPHHLGKTYTGRISTSLKYKLEFLNWWITDEHLLTESFAVSQKQSQELSLKAMIKLTFYSAYYPNKWSVADNFVIQEIEITRFPYLNKGYFVINGSPKIIIGFPAGAEKVLLTPLKSKKKEKELRFEDNARKSKSNKNAIIMNPTGIRTREGLLSYSTVLKQLGFEDEYLRIERITGNNPLFLSNLEDSTGNIDVMKYLEDFPLNSYQRKNLNKRFDLSTRLIGKELAETYICGKNRYPKGTIVETKEMAEDLSIYHDFIKVNERGLEYPIVGNGFANFELLLEKENLPTDIIPRKMIVYTPPYIESPNPSNDEGLEERLQINKTIFYNILNPLKIKYPEEKDRDKLISELKAKFETSEIEGLTLYPQDLLAMINLYSRYLSQLEEDDDIDSLEHKRLIYISEVFEEGLMEAINSLLTVIERRESVLTRNSKTNYATAMESPLRYTGGVSITKLSSMHPLYETLDTTNPLSQINIKRKVSSKQMDGYDGGVPQESSDARQRSVNHSFPGRLDIIETPESGSVGLVRHISLMAQLNRDGELVAPFLRVDKEKKELDLSTVHYMSYEEERKYNRILSPSISDKDGVEIQYFKNNLLVKEEFYKIKLNNQSKEVFEQEAIMNLGKYDADNYKIIIHRKNWFTDENNLIFLTGEGETKEGTWKDIDLVSVTGSHVFSPVTSAIPFVEYDDATRAMMGSVMSKQAISIWGKEKQRVYTPVSKKVSVTSNGVITAPYDCVINSFDTKGIWITPIADEDKEEYIPLVSNERTVKSSLNKSKPTPGLRVGSVKLKGEVIADSSSTIDGELAHGVNLLIGYMPMDGDNYEDAILISDRLLREDVLTSFHIEEYEIPIISTVLEKDRLVNSVSELTSIPNLNISQNDLEYLKENESSFTRGIINEGTKVTQGDIIGYKITSEERENVREKFITYKFEGKLGVVVEVTHNKSLGVYNIKVATRLKIDVGDKLTGRHGNKGVISKIVPQADMPYLEDGRRLDVCLTPLGIPSRMNLGQVLEGLAGFKLESLGLRGEVEQMSSSFDIDKFRTIMSDEDGSDKVQLYNPKTGMPYRFKTLVVVSYMEKLEHISSQKIHARGIGKGCTYSVNKQPLQGKAANGGQRIGEMEMWIMQDHGCSNILRELTQYKSDDEHSRRMYTEYLEMKNKGGVIDDNFEAPGNVPYAFRAMTALMTGYYSFKFYDSAGNQIDPNVPSAKIEYRKGEVVKRTLDRDYEKHMKKNKVKEEEEVSTLDDLEMSLEDLMGMEDDDLLLDIDWDTDDLDLNLEEETFDFIEQYIPEVDITHELISQELETYEDEDKDDVVEVEDYAELED